MRATASRVGDRPQRVAHALLVDHLFDVVGGVDLVGEAFGQGQTPDRGGIDLRRLEESEAVTAGFGGRPLVGEDAFCPRRFEPEGADDANRPARLAGVVGVGHAVAVEAGIVLAQDPLRRPIGDPPGRRLIGIDSLGGVGQIDPHRVVGGSVWSAVCSLGEITSYGGATTSASRTRSRSYRRPGKGSNRGTLPA